ncbi:hypothetical protein [Rhizobium sp. BT-175]|uniref:hypothetical protein n=1 Tax=Rhizobium sp. BT-175 TaxID=2986929 RepID=UPI0022356450|nr:hypothetical protein [Rhizobium sp. BT-175]MCV9947447.1 hypothetical protein [Rhizobium sp. BT-175]
MPDDISNHAETPVPVDDATDTAASGGLIEDLRPDEKTARQGFGVDRGESADAFSWDVEPEELTNALLLAASLPFTLWHHSLTLAQMFWVPIGLSPLRQADIPSGGAVSDRS